MSERRKWLSQFDNVDAVLYVVGLDGYDQSMAEDGKTNRLRDSLDLFKDMCDSPYFCYTNFLLFLNKRDIFKEKIKKVPLKTCFRSYDGDQHDFEQCITYIRKRFVDVYNKHIDELRKSNNHRLGGNDVLLPSIYPFVTTATDTIGFQEFIVVASRSIFLRSGMFHAGLVNGQ